MFRRLIATWVLCLLNGPSVGLESLFLCSDSMTMLLFLPIGSKTKEGVVQGVASGTGPVPVLYGE